jgi:glycosyltransferase involved in cell wall biosynthesis
MLAMVPPTTFSDCLVQQQMPAPIQLALVITELAPGGAERCLVELATRLDRSRFSAIVYSLGPHPAKSKQSLVNRLAEAGIPTNFLGLTKKWEYFTAVRKLAQMLRVQRAQIVQSFLFHANVIAARAAKGAGVPHLISGIRVADPRRWRTAVESLATARADRFVCVSQSVAEFCRRRGFASEKLLVIPNGIDLARWRDVPGANLAQLGVPSTRRVLLFVGRLDKQKGLDRFFRELPVVFRELPEHDLVLAGEGGQRAALARSAQRLGIASRIHFVGWQDEIAALMAAADVVVLPSRWEGMPNVVLEAMAAGKPVISTQAEGTVELLGLAALEQTAPVGDWDGLRSRLIEVATDMHLRDDLGRRNQGRAQQFSLEDVAERYQRLYKSLRD